MMDKQMVIVSLVFGFCIGMTIVSVMKERADVAFLSSMSASTLYFFSKLKGE